MTSTAPAYDISLDEMSVALSFATMALGEASVPAAPVAVAAQAKTTTGKKEGKKAEKKTEKKVEDVRILFGAIF